MFAQLNDDINLYKNVLETDYSTYDKTWEQHGNALCRGTEFAITPEE